MKPAKIAKYKRKVVEDFARLIREYPIIAAVDMENLPAPQLQKMRSQLKELVVLKMAKRRLIRIAIEQAKKDKKEIGKIEPYLTGMPALMFTKENPFRLYKIIGKSKSSAPAKAGQIAPYDLIIPAGPTAFAPGPIIGELGMLGIKTSVEGGKIAVVSDSVVVEEGEVIKPKVAELLARFNIEPMEIGLNITAIYENGTIYKRDVLAIDEAAFLKQLQDAHTWAFNLAVEAGYYTKEVVETMIPKAFNEAKALAKEAKIMCDMIAGELVETAERQALNLKAEAKIPDEPVQAKVEKVEKKIEETKQEIRKIEEKKQEVSETKDVSEHDQKSPISDKKKEDIK
ncbi:50S ribosomal protein L10, partial [Candidatus Woesearchaeota archaeon]|nr:50S ribosomal protein L10 [Candidatus Woesearchaeota archaeon]